MTTDHGEDGAGSSRLMADEDVVLGDYDGKFNFLCEARPETIGSYLKAHCGSGSDTVSTPGGATLSRLHSITPQDTFQPVTLERRLGTYNKSQVAQGAVVNEIGFEYAKGALMMSGQGVFQKDTIEATPSTPTFDANRPFLKHECVVTLGGATTGVKALKFKSTRKVATDDYETGSRYRISADISQSDVSLEADLVYRDATLWKRSLGGASATTPQDDPLYNADAITITGPIIEAALHYSLTIDLPRTHWKPIAPPLKTREGITQKVQARVLHSTASGYQWKASLQNTQTTV